MNSSQKQLNNWSRLKLSWFGRIAAIKLKIFLKVFVFVPKYGDKDITRFTEKYPNYDKHIWDSTKLRIKVCNTSTKSQTRYQSLDEEMGWIRMNILKLNPTKTQVLFLGPNLILWHMILMTIEGVAFSPSSSGCSLGIPLDQVCCLMVRWWLWPGGSITSYDSSWIRWNLLW